MTRYTMRVHGANGDPTTTNMYKRQSPGDVLRMIGMWLGTPWPVRITVEPRR